MGDFNTKAILTIEEQDVLSKRVSLASSAVPANVAVFAKSSPSSPAMSSDEEPWARCDWVEVKGREVV